MQYICMHVYSSVYTEFICSLQFLGCVAPNVRYHAPKSNSLIPGVAVRVPDFLCYLDKHGIPHRSQKSIRKRAKKSKRCAPRMRQFFLKKGVIISSRKIRRSLSTCKGCICVSEEELEERFITSFKKGR